MGFHFRRVTIEGPPDSTWLHLTMSQIRGHTAFVIEVNWLSAATKGKCATKHHHQVVQHRFKYDVVFAFEILTLPDKYACGSLLCCEIHNQLRYFHSIPRKRNYPNGDLMSCRATAHLDAELQSMAPVSVAGKERPIHNLRPWLWRWLFNLHFNFQKQTISYYKGQNDTNLVIATKTILLVPDNCHEQVYKLVNTDLYGPHYEKPSLYSHTYTDYDSTCTMISCVRSILHSKNHRGQNNQNGPHSEKS